MVNGSTYSLENCSRNERRFLLAIKSTFFTLGFETTRPLGLFRRISDFKQSDRTNIIVNVPKQYHLLQMVR